MDTQTVPMWGQFQNYEQANAPREDAKVYVTPEEDSGYVLRIDDLTEAAKSPFENRDKNGKLLPPSYQTNITFTIVDYPNDDPDQSVVGQAIRKYYTISLYSGSNFYKLAKAAFGGELDPHWVPNDEDLKGRLVSATLTRKQSRADENKFFADVAAVTAYRGRKKDFSHIAANQRWLSREEWEARQNGDTNASNSSGPATSLDAEMEDVPF